jgi:hypothetical protein
VSVIGCVGVLTAATAQGQAGALSDRDYVELRQLAAQYAQSLDRGGDGGRSLANLFVEDGELVRPDARGRSAIAAAVQRAEQGPAHVAHFALNHVIQPTRDGAAGWQYVVELRFDSPAAQGGRRSGGSPPSQRSLVGSRGGELVSVGRYEDLYARTADGWRFRRREFIPGSATFVLPPAPSGTSVNADGTARLQAAQQQGSALSADLTTSDYLEIEELVSSYGHALDSGFNASDNGVAYAGLFTPDGVFYSRGRPVRGHDALAELARAQPHGPEYVRHYLTNHVITASEGKVTGRQYLVVIDVGEKGAPTTIYLGGYYEDVYVKTPQGWRFLERRSFGARQGP